MSWVPAARSMRAAAFFAVLAVVVCISFAVVQAMRPRNLIRVNSVTSSGDEGPVVGKVTNPGYVGPQACATCHAERLAEFSQTRHFLAMCVPEPGRMPPGFIAGRGTYQVPDLPVQFEMTETSAGYSQQTRQPSEAASTRTTSSAIAFVYGARGGNDEVYFTWHGDRLYELPMVWLAPLQTWGTSPFDRHGQGDFSRDMTIRCVECHNTWVEHVPGSRNQYGHDHIIQGVTCEVCHGPGKDHVTFHQQNPQAKDPQAVVRPATLPRERLMDLCAQCHSNALKHRGPAFRYRPGEPLDDHYFTITTKHPEDDHVANQTTYLRESRCFQQSETLTCVSCHNPHQPRLSTNAGSVSCRQCHQPDDCTDRVRLPVGVQDDCVGCHMPERRKIQVSFRTANDKYIAPVPRSEHRIAVYPEARAKILLEWHRTQPESGSQQEADRLSKWLGDYYRGESEKRRTEFRFLAAIDACRNAITFDADIATQEKLAQFIGIQSDIDTNLQDGLWHAEQGRHERAVECLQRVLELKPGHSIALGKIGTAYAVLGKRELADKSLKLAAESDPNDPYPLAMLGWLAYLDGRADEALEFYRRADAVEPYTVKINHQMGLVLARLDRWPEAALRFSKATSIDPSAASSVLALSQAQRHQHQLTTALETGQHAVRLTRSQNAETLLNLADIYADLGKWDEAIETAEKLLALVESRDPQSATQVRRRLVDYRMRRQDRK